jgi:hypothetical protein
MIPTHPIFLVINFIGIFVLVFLGMVVTNVYGELVAGTGAEYFEATAELFPYMNQLIIYLPYLGAIIVFITSIVMFTRST